MANNPAFAASNPRSSSVLNPTTAYTTITSPGATTTLFTAGTNGSKVEQIRINQLQATSATGSLIIYIYNGTTNYMIDLYSFAITATIPVSPVDLYYNAMLLSSGQSLVVATSSGGIVSSAAAFSLTAFGADF
jgi:hypothetical protein